MDSAKLKRLTAAASGREPADLVVKNCRIVNVFTKQIMNGDIAVTEGHFAGIGAYRGAVEKDGKGSYAVPGLIDAHVHIESSLASPQQFAAAVIPRGTVSVIADPHEIVNVCGERGITYMAEAASCTPLRVHIMLPSCVPSTTYETAAADFNHTEMASLIREERIRGLGEMMAYRQVIDGDQEVLEKILLARRFGKPVDGHCPGISGQELSAYVAAGILTDHECSDAEELLERIDRGMYGMLRQGSAAKDLLKLLPAVNEGNAHRCLFCSDDRHPQDILATGHIDNHLRLAVSNGIDPVTAICMATFNAAQCYCLRDQGAIAPGYHADFLLCDDLQTFDFREVYIGGKLVAKDSRLIKPIPVGAYGAVSHTVHADPVEPKQLGLPLPSGRARVISLQPGSLITGSVIRDVLCDAGGWFASKNNPGLCKLAVIERHRRTGNIGIGLVERYSVTEGAIALSIAHDSHNIIVLGDRDEFMVQAVNQVIADGGGIALVSRGKVAAKLPLPIAGLMSDLPIQQICARIGQLEEIAHRELRVDPEFDPIMSLSFLALPVIPELRLTDRGLFDVNARQFVDVAL